MTPDPQEIARARAAVRLALRRRLAGLPLFVAGVATLMLVLGRISVLMTVGQLIVATAGLFSIGVYLTTDPVLNRRLLVAAYVTLAVGYVLVVLHYVVH